MKRPPVVLISGLLTVGIITGGQGNASPADDAGTGLSFNHGVAQIFYDRCSTCHREGAAQPVLLTYSQVSSQKDRILAAVTSGRMPPWKPVAGFGEFKNPRIIPASEKQAILAWIGAAMPEGSAADWKAPPKHSEAWELGTPDLVVTMSKPFALSAHDHDHYECFVLRLGLTEDRPIWAFEVRPGNGTALHHSIIFIDNSGETEKRGDDGSGYECFGGPGFPPSGTLGGWSPGARAITFPEGVGKVIKRGANLVMQNHYHPNGNATEDQTSVGIYFSRAAPKSLAIGIPVVQENIDIPPGRRDFRIDTSFVTPIDLKIFAIFPHMHLLGREIKAWASLPDQQTIPLIWINDWDFNWQGDYFYANPIVLPKGTKVLMEVSYDNSSGNKRNPNHPSRRVIYGDQSTDEMAVCVLEASVEKTDDLAALQRAILQQPGVVGIDDPHKH